MNDLIYVVYTLGYDSRIEIHKNRKYSEWGVFNNLKAVKLFMQYLVNSTPNIAYFKIRLPDNKIMSAVTFCEIFHIEKQSFNERMII